MNEWVTIALLGKPRGNRGEVTATSLSDHPERFALLAQVNVAGELISVEEAWFHQSNLIFKFAGIDSISAAEQLQGQEVRVPYSDRARLDSGEYYLSDLIGCEVRDRQTGLPIGTVTGFEEGGASGLLQVGPKILIPFTKDLCVSIATEQRLILVDLPEGLLELNP